MYHINILLFDQFELLDAFGPAEIFGKDFSLFDIHYYSKNGGIIESSQKSKHITEMYPKAYVNGHFDKHILLIPGGAGTRNLVNDVTYIKYIEQLSRRSDYTLCVCTGSALLAKTDLLNGHTATTNKRAFEWVKAQNNNVKWVKEARWVVSDHFYTSSGISAGMDMALGFISDMEGKEKAIEISNRIEYSWHDNPEDDPFSK